MGMYFLLVIVAILFSTTFIFNKNFQKSRGDGCDSNLLFQMNTAMVTVFLMLVLNRFRIEVTLFSVIMGVVYAIDIILYIYFCLKAFCTANLSVFSIFAMLGGMILPFIYGTAFCDEGITLAKVMSCVFIAIALLLTFEKGKNSKKCITYYLAVFVFNGMMGVISKIHQSYAEMAVDSRSYVAITYTVVFVISLLWYIKRNGKITMITKKEFMYTTCFAVCNGVAELCCLIALTKLPASVQYPIVTGGTILFSAVVSAVIEKQRSVKSICSAVIALIASIIIIL